MVSVMVVVALVVLIIHNHFKNNKLSIHTTSQIESQQQLILEKREDIAGLYGRITEMEKSLLLKDRQIIEIESKSKLDNKRSLVLGQNTIKGELVQILASFYLLSEYDSLSLVSSVSRQASFDVIGIKKDRIDFIEIKSSKNAILTNSEINIKNIINSKNVFYRVIEGTLPKMDIKDRMITNDNNKVNYS